MDDFYEEPHSAEPMEEDQVHIGDIVMLQFNSAKFPSNASMTDISELTNDRILCVEGLGDKVAYAIPAKEIGPYLPLCLFRLEAPQSLRNLATISDSYAADLEQVVRKATFSNSQGKKLCYLQKLQLKHLHSGGLLSLDVLKSSGIPGTWMVKAESRSSSDLNVLEVLPFNSLHKAGAPVLYSHSLAFYFYKEAINFYLSAADVEGKWHTVTTHKIKSWHFLKFQGYRTTGNLVRVGVPVFLRQKHSQFKLAVRERGAVFSSNCDQFAAMWMLEATHVNGGNITWQSPFYLKHLQTDLYLQKDCRTLGPKPTQHTYFCFEKVSHLETAVEYGVRMSLTVVLPEGNRSLGSRASMAFRVFEKLLNADENSREEEPETVAKRSQSHEVAFELLKATNAEFISKIHFMKRQFYDLKASMVNANLQRQRILAKNCLGALEKLTQKLIYTESPKAFAYSQCALIGVNFHTLLLDICDELPSLQKQSFSQLILKATTDSHMQMLYASVWKLLSYVAYENSYACRQLMHHEAVFTRFLSHSPESVVSILKQLYSKVEFRPKNPQVFFNTWVSRIAQLSADNLETQVMYFDIIGSLVMPQGKVVPEYQHLVFKALSELPHLVRVKLPRSDPPVAVFEGRGSFLADNADLRAAETSEATVRLEDLTDKLAKYAAYVGSYLKLVVRLFTNSLQERPLAESLLGCDVSYLASLALDLNIPVQIRVACFDAIDFLGFRFDSSVKERKSYSDYAYQLHELQEFNTSLRSFYYVPDCQHSEIITKCLRWCLDLWLKRKKPMELEGRPIEECMMYLRAGFRVTYSLIHYRLCSPLFTECISRYLVYFLVGFCNSNRDHWVEKLLKTAKERSKADIREKIVLASLFSEVLEFFKMVAQHRQQTKLVKLLNLCYDHAEALSKVGILFLFNKQAFSGVDSSLFLRIIEDSELMELHPGFLSDVLSDERNLTRTNTFREVLDKEPPLSDVLLGSILLDSDIPEDQKAAAVSLAQSYLNEKQIILKHLGRAEIIVHSEITQTERLILTHLEAAEVLLCRVENSETDAAVLRQIVEELKPVINLVHFRNADNPTFFKKLQNILRHKALHLRMFRFWTVLSSVEAAYPALSLVVTFFTLFCWKNPPNCKAIAKLVQPSMLDAAIPQTSLLIREIVCIKTLKPSDLSEIVELIVHDRVDTAPHTLDLLNALLFDYEGKPRNNVQNLISRVLYPKLSAVDWENVSNCLLVAKLLRVLTYCTIDNIPVVFQCRKLIKPFQFELALSSMSWCHEAVLAVFEYIYYVHVKKYPDSEPFKDLDVIIQVIYNVKPILTGILETASKLPDIAETSLYEHAFAKLAQADRELKWTMPDSVQAQVDSWRLLSQGSDIMPASGLLLMLTGIFEEFMESELFMHVIPNIYDSCIIIKPLLNDFKTDPIYARYDFSLLVQHFDRFFCSIEQYIRAHKPDLLFEGARLNAPARKFLLPFLRRKIVQSLVEKDSKTEAEQAKLDGALQKFVKTFAEVVHSDTHSFEENFTDIFSSNKLFQDSELNPEEEVELVDVLTRLKNAFVKNNLLFFQCFQTMITRFQHKKQTFNRACFEAGIVMEALDVFIHSESVSVQNTAVSFLIVVFDEPNIDLMLQFKQLLLSSGLATPLFRTFAYLLRQTSTRLKIRARSEEGIAFAKLTRVERIFFSAIKRDRGSRIVEYSCEDELAVNVLRLIQLCCDNCNMEFQNFMRSQSSTETDVDVVTCVADLLTEIRSLGRYLVAAEAAKRVIQQSMETLIDFLTGPCSANQLHLGENVKLYLALNQLVTLACEDRSLSSTQTLRKVLTFYSTLLEGKAIPSVTANMVKFIDLQTLVLEVIKIYDNNIKGKEQQVLLERDDDLSEEERERIKAGLVACIFLIQLKEEYPQLPLLKEFDIAGEHSRAVSFYLKFIGHVEVRKDKELLHCYFPIPFKMTYLTAASKQRLIMEVSHESHKAKLEDFLQQVDICKQEMKYQQCLSQTPWFKQLTSHWSLYRRLSYFLLLLINLLLVFTAQRSDDDLLTVPQPIFVLMGLPQVLLEIAGFVFYLVEFYPYLQLKGNTRKSGLEFEAFWHLPDNHSVFMHGIYKESRTIKESKAVFTFDIGILLKLLLTSSIFYQLSYLVVCLLAIVYPWLYPALLLDIMVSNKELVSVLKSITLNLQQLFLSVCIGAIVIYLFSVLGFLQFNSYFEPENKANCSTLWNCFVTTVNEGARSDSGIGNAMTEPLPEDYSWRVLFDLSFFIIVNVILLNIIFGVIIDTFGELRELKNSVIEDVNDRCFICGEERGQIELRGFGWSRHFMTQHSPFSYLGFIVHIQDQLIQDCNGIEKHVRLLVEAKNTSFFPSIGDKVD
jgi:hypothetical protein